MSQGQDAPWASPPQPLLLPGLSCLLWRLVKAGPRGRDSSCGPGEGPGAGGGGEEGRGRLKDAGPLPGPSRSRESPRPPAQQIQGVRSKTSGIAPTPSPPSLISTSCTHFLPPLCHLSHPSLRTFVPAVTPPHCPSRPASCRRPPVTNQPSRGQPACPLSQGPSPSSQAVPGTAGRAQPPGPDCRL